MFKKMKSQGTLSTLLVDSDIPSPNASESSVSPAHKFPQIQENDMYLGGSCTSSTPLEEEELVYDAELLSHDPRKRINTIDYSANQKFN